MKKLLLLILSLSVSLGMLVPAATAANLNQENKGGFMGEKILVVYFSWGGHAKSLAEKIHAKVGGDMFAIETVDPYPTDYHETAYGIAKTQKEQGIHPAIKNTQDINFYDTVFLGTPVWWYTMAPPVMTFLEKNDFKGKTIIPFITHGGGGKYTIPDDIGKLAKGATVLAPLVIYEGGDSGIDKEIEKWLKDIK